MKTFRIGQLFCIALLAVGLTACKTTKGGFGGADGDYVNGVPLPERKDGASYLGGNVSKGQFPPVQFGFDSVEISGSELGKVRTVAQAMKSSRNDMIVAGFTDERGTEEYNRGLGERRAQAVREALIREGVNGGRLQTVSFGEEMPVDSGSGEAAWAANRRAEFGLIR